eukprot:6894548-Prymnesium_polylepis.1
MLPRASRAPQPPPLVRFPAFPPEAVYGERTLSSLGGATCQFAMNTRTEAFTATLTYGTARRPTRRPLQGTQSIGP